MVNEKQIRARQQQKIDNTQNWDIADKNGFVPKNGEIIIYKDDEQIAKIKIGDGQTTVKNLPFLPFTEGGIYVGSGEMPEDCNIQIDPNGDTLDGSDLVNKEELRKALDIFMYDEETGTLYINT